MSNSRAIGAAALAALAAMALRALDHAQEARAVVAAGARESVILAHDPDLAPAAKAWGLPDDGGASNSQ